MDKTKKLASTILNSLKNKRILIAAGVFTISIAIIFITKKLSESPDHFFQVAGTGVIEIITEDNTYLLDETLSNFTIKPQYWHFNAENISMYGIQLLSLDPSANWFCVPNDFWHVINMSAATAIETKIYLPNNVPIQISVPSNKVKSAFIKDDTFCHNLSNYSVQIFIDSNIAIRNNLIEIKNDTNKSIIIKHYNMSFKHFIASHQFNSQTFFGSSIAKKYYSVSLNSFKKNKFGFCYSKGKNLRPLHLNLQTREKPVKGSGHWTPTFAIKCKDDIIDNLNVRVVKVIINKYFGDIQLAAQEKKNFVDANIEITKIQDGILTLNVKNDSLQIYVKGNTSNLNANGINLISGWEVELSKKNPVLLAIVVTILSTLVIEGWHIIVKGKKQ